MPNKKPSILIVDDDQNLRSIYAYDFAKENFDVVEANDGLEGLNLVKKQKPDVIFTGIMMPNMDGFELLKILKSNVETSGIPVLISSHMGKEEDRKKAASLGAREFLVKGMISPIEIVARVKDLLLKKIYKVSINVHDFDAANLMKDYKLSGQILLELNSHDSRELEFNAKIIPVKEEEIKLDFKD